MQNDDTEDMFAAADALMMLANSTPASNTAPLRRSARIAGRA